MNTFVKIAFLFCVCGAVVESHRHHKSRSRSSSSEHRQPENVITPVEFVDLIYTLPISQLFEAHQFIESLKRHVRTDSKIYSFLKDIPWSMSVTDGAKVKKNPVSETHGDQFVNHDEYGQTGLVFSEPARIENEPVPRNNPTSTTGNETVTGENPPSTIGNETVAGNNPPATIGNQAVAGDNPPATTGNQAVAGDSPPPTIVPQN